MAAAKKVEVTVKPNTVVYHDGEAHVAGQVIKVSDAEAKTLLEQGVIEKA